MIAVSQWFPYSLTRTWHLQLAIFWIATAFLSVGLFLGPLVNGGKDPPYQKLGVNILFVALVVVVVGTLTGNFLAIKQVMPEHLNFWLGHQGYEYLDLGRVWQLALFIGIVFWLGLMLRAFIPALKQGGDKNLLALLCTSTIAIGLFYGTGLFYGERTNITIMEYWRWWVAYPALFITSISRAPQRLLWRLVPRLARWRLCLACFIRGITMPVLRLVVLRMPGLRPEKSCNF